MQDLKDIKVYYLQFVFINFVYGFLEFFLLSKIGKAHHRP